MDATDLDIIIFFTKLNGQMEALIISLVMRVLKKIIKILIFIFIWRMNVGTDINDESICLIDSATTHKFCYQWTLKEECYELMVVHWFDTLTHMIDTHMIHDSLCKYLY